MLKSSTFRLQFNSEAILLFLLFGLTMLSSAFHVTFFYGITYTFTSIFLFLIFRIFGLRLAIFATILTFLFVPHHYIYISYNIILLAEILFVGVYFHIKKRAKMFFVAAFFWLTIGISALFFLNYSSLTGDTLYFQIFKDILNGLFNVLIADMLLAYLPFYRLLKTIPLNKNNVSIHQFLSHLTIVSIMIPFFIIISTKTLTAHELIINNSKTEAEQTVNQIIKELDKSFFSSSSIDNGHLESNLIKSVIGHKSPEFDIFITNFQNEIITSNSNTHLGQYLNWDDGYDVEEISDNFFEVLPKGQNEVLPILKWRSGKLIYVNEVNSYSMKIYIQYPISQYQDNVFKELLFHFKLSFVYLLFTVIIVSIVNRLLMNNIKQLILVTTDLPQKIKNLEKIDWPIAYISELRFLSNNLKEMAQKIRELFQESIAMNKDLTTQTEKLKASEDKLHQLAYYDVLTSLPNRLHFQNYVKSFIENQPNGCIGVIFIDLNQFKQVNDILGHDAGDTLLQLIANKFRNLQNENRVVFRLGGDEFVFVHKVKDRSEVYDTLDGIRQEFSSPSTISGQVLYTTGSIGVSMYPDDGQDLDTLVKCADIAMYASKEKVGNPPQFYKRMMKDRFQERLLIENELRKVVDHGGFNLFYQPKIKEGIVTSLEALLRWDDPSLGNVSPSIFIPLAEEIGIITKIDEWTLMEACKQNKKWQEEYLIKIPISVNISAKNFQHNHLISWIENALYQSGMSPQYLKLEITESVFIENLEHVAKIINQVKDLGVQISIDDFGKGYSSLIQLLQLPIDEIKIDRKFITGIDLNIKQELLVKSIIDMAHGLQLNIVAEGIETNSEKNLLIQMGCDELQGYLFSLPLSSSDMQKYLYENTSNDSSNSIVAI